MMGLAMEASKMANIVCPPGDDDRTDTMLTKDHA
jgi:hypothetical protein